MRIAYKMEYLHPTDERTDIVPVKDWNKKAINLYKKSGLKIIEF